MFSLRLVSRLIPSQFLARPAVLASRRLGLSSTRTFVNSAPLFATAAKATATSTKTKTKKKAAAPKKAATKKPAATKKKPAPKKKAATKKKPVVAKKKRAAKPKPAGPKPLPKQLKGELKLPKGAPGPYILYIKDQVSGSIHSRQEANDAIRQCAKEWNALSEAERQPYIDRAKKVKEQRDKDYLEWWNSRSGGTLRLINRIRVAQGKKKIRKPAGVPKRPATGFTRFLMEYRDPSVSFKDSLGLQGAQWRALPEEEKAKYNVEAKEELRKWKEEHGFA